MFGQNKPKPVAEVTFGGWLERDIHDFAERLTKKRPHLSFEITGIRHLIKFNGEEFASAVTVARSRQEMYIKSALAFNDRPASEDSLFLTAYEHELVGFMIHPRVRMRCQFGVGNTDQIKEVHLGDLSLTGENNGSDKDAYQPIVEAYFNVQLVEQEADLRRTMQAALADRGNAFMNFVLCPIENAHEWATCLMKNGYSPSVKITGAYATSNVGYDPFK